MTSAFEKDQRTGGVTHKIDSNVDQEREFLGECFREAGALSGTNYLTPRTWCVRRTPPRAARSNLTAVCWRWCWDPESMLHGNP